MLVLSRRLGEAIYLGDTIRVTVLNIQGKNVKLGLEVPPELLVYREEVYKRVQEENKLAISSNNDDLMMAAKLWNKVKTK